MYGNFSITKQKNTVFIDICTIYIAFLRKSRRFNDKRAKSEKWWYGNTKGIDPNESDDEEGCLVRGDLIRVRTGDNQKSLN